ncbi:MAG TPA: GyrI-like domain-containing protein [Candidatus Eremiobacteraceae bacterium]
MAYEIATKTVAAQPTLFVRGATTIPQIAQSIGEFLSAVGGHLREHGIQPAGMPYTRYHKIDGANIDLEAGMPIANAADGSERVIAGELPAGPVASTVHIGPYERLPDAGAALADWAAKNGKRQAGPNWEIYLNDPTEVAGPHEYRTEVVMPLAQ